MNEEASMRLTSRDGEPVLLEGVRANGRLQDTLLSMTIEQRYRNTTRHHIEAVYTFPLPWGSVLMGVEVVLGGKTLSGQVNARQQADQRYEQALSRGDAAILLERNGDGSHTLNLGNLAPGEDCVVRIRYAQSMGVEQGSVRLTLPKVMALRKLQAEHVPVLCDWARQEALSAPQLKEKLHEALGVQVSTWVVQQTLGREGFV